MNTPGLESNRERRHFTQMAIRFSGMAFSVLIFFSILGAPRAHAEFQFRCAEMFERHLGLTLDLVLPDPTPLIFRTSETSPVDLALRAFQRSRNGPDLLTLEELGPLRAEATAAMQSRYPASPPGSDPLIAPDAPWLASGYVLDLHHQGPHVAEFLTIAAVRNPAPPHWFELNNPPRWMVAITLIVRTSANEDRRIDAGRVAERSRRQMLDRIALAIERHMELLKRDVSWLRQTVVAAPHFDRIEHPGGVTEDVIAYRFDARARIWFAAPEISEASFRGFIETLLDRNQ